MTQYDAKVEQEVELEERVEEYVELGLDHSQYTIIPIAQGGEGELYHYVSENEKDLAVKKVRLSKTNGWHTIERLERQAVLLAHVEPHKNIAGYVGFETEEIKTRTGVDTDFYLMTEWIEGKDLSFGEYSQSQVEEIIEQVTAGLRHAYRFGIIHRDIKPSNIVMQEDNAKLVDFGVAKKLGQTTMTDSIAGFGYINYWAPEVRAGEAQTHESDLYALGVVAVELLRGKLFDGIVTDQEVYSALEKMVHVNSSLQDKVKTLLSKDPNERRYWEREEVLEIIEPVVEEVTALRVVEAPKVSIDLPEEFSLEEQRQFVAPFLYADSVKKNQSAVLSAINIARVVGKNQRCYIGAGNVANKVGREQVTFAGVGNVASEVGRHQITGIGAGNVAKKVGKDQITIFGGGNVANEVGQDQRTGIGIGNVANKVGQDQGTGMGVGNVANKVGRDQETLVGVGNIAKEVGQHQITGMGVGNIANKVGGIQLTVVGGINIAKEFGQHQRTFVGVGNIANEVGRDQGTGMGVGNVAKKVSRDQETLVGVGNIAKEVGRHQITGIGAGNVAKKVGKDQITIFGGGNVANEVGQDQRTGIGIGNVANKVGQDQGTVMGVGNVANKVGRDQETIIGGINIANEVGQHQITGMGVGNVAKEVGQNQVTIIGGINVAKEVYGVQITLIPTVNIAKRVGKNQWGLVNIVTDEIGGKQMGFLNYAKTLGEEAAQYGVINMCAENSKPKERAQWNPRRYTASTAWWNPEIKFGWRSSRKPKEKKKKKVKKPKVKGPSLRERLKDVLL